MANTGLVTNLVVNRQDPTDSSLNERHDVTQVVSALSMTVVDIDPTLDTVSGVFTLPTSALVIAASAEVTEAFAGGTSVEVGLVADPDGLFSLTTPSVGSVAASGVDVGTVVGGAYKVTVTGTYTTGKATLKIFWMETKQTVRDASVSSDSSQATLGLYDSLADSSLAGTQSL